MVDSKALREAARKLEDAADHVDGVAAAAFNWGGLLSIIITILQALVPILGNTTVPPKP